MLQVSVRETVYQSDFSVLVAVAYQQSSGVLALDRTQASHFKRQTGQFNHSAVRLDCTIAASYKEAVTITIGRLLNMRSYYISVGGVACPSTALEIHVPKVGTRHESDDMIQKAEERRQLGRDRHSDDDQHAQLAGHQHLTQIFNKRCMNTTVHK